MTKSSILGLALVIVGSAARVAAAPPAATPSAHADVHAVTAGLTPQKALDQLMAGNARFASGRPLHPRGGPARRTELATTQHPSAVIVGCSDSRVSPELVFDTGLGDVFVIRTAGNRLDDLVLASIEYAVEHLGSSVVVVLGHERCGAVSAAVTSAQHPGQSDEPEGSHVPVLVRTLQDAVAATNGKEGDPVENAVVENVRIVVADLPKQSAQLADAVKAGKLEIVGARYDLDTGAVTRIDAAAATPAR